ncbi:MAG: PTS sugar transporter subunit IIC [Erysipelotrichaceae bacterium]
MHAFQLWMEEKFVPVAAKIGSEKHLVAVRDAFISVMPITMAGSIATLLNVLVRDLPPLFNNTSIPEAFGWLIGINGNVWWGTNAVFALVFVFALGYQLCKAYDVNPLSGGLVAFASMVAAIPQAASEAAGWGTIAWGYTNAESVFTALFVGFVATLIFIALMKAKLTIKLPDSVPPAVSKAFAAIIPGTAAIYTFGALTYVLATFFETNLKELIFTNLQAPFMALAQGLPAILIMTLFVQLFWFFGLHGSNVLGPVIDGLYKTALLDNQALYQNGTAWQDLPHLWTRGSFDAYAWMGGAGCTLALVIAILWLGKRADEKTVAQLSAPMGVFNINEPVMYGVPVVLSPVYFIPFIVISPILVTIGYLATVSGLVPPVFLEIPWVVPPVIYAFLATGGNIMAAGVALFNLVLAVLIWGVFVRIANKQVEVK